MVQIVRMLGQVQRDPAEPQGKDDGKEGYKRRPRASACTAVLVHTRRLHVGRL